MFPITTCGNGKGGVGTSVAPYLTDEVRYWVMGDGGAVPNPVTAAAAGTTCYAIKQNDPSAVDGYYWLAGPGYDLTTYCDMSGGGWTLVGRERQQLGNGNYDGAHNAVLDRQTYTPFFNGCGCSSSAANTTCMVGCAFNEDRARAPLSGQDQNAGYQFWGSTSDPLDQSFEEVWPPMGRSFAWVNDFVKGTEQKQDFLNHGSPATFGTEPNVATHTTGSATGIMSAMCTKVVNGAAVYTLQRLDDGACDVSGYNLNIGTRTVVGGTDPAWNPNMGPSKENDELCYFGPDEKCFNNGPQQPQFTQATSWGTTNAVHTNEVRYWVKG